MNIIDIHGHTTPKPGFLNRQGETLCTPDQLVEIMDRLGVARTVILPLTSPETFEFVQSNDETFAACDRFPGRFIRFCNVDPRTNDNNPDHDFVPILSYYRSLGCKGLGELTANLWWDDPRVHRLLAGCEAVGLPVTFHVAVREFRTYGLISEPGLGGLERALRKFPGLQFLGHSQAFWSEVGPVSEKERGGYPKGPVLPGGRVPELLRRCGNLWGDLSAFSGYNALSRDPDWGYAFLEDFQDRLLFGLDICAPSNKTPLPAFLKEAAESGRISATAYDKIVRLNARRLLKLDDAPSP